MKRVILIFLLTTLMWSCKKDKNSVDPKNNIDPNGLFIELDGDTRYISSTSTETYHMHLSKTELVSDAYEHPPGFEFDMTAVDTNKQYIGGIGGLDDCITFDLKVKVFTKDDFVENEKVTMKTSYLYWGDIKKLLGKAYVTLEFKDKEGNILKSGTVSSEVDQSIEVEKKNGDYYLNFKDLKFFVYEDQDFTASARIILKKDSSK